MPDGTLTIELPWNDIPFELERRYRDPELKYQKPSLVNPPQADVDPPTVLPNGCVNHSFNEININSVSRTFTDIENPDKQPDIQLNGCVFVLWMSIKTKPDTKQKPRPFKQ